MSGTAVAHEQGPAGEGTHRHRLLRAIVASSLFVNVLLLAAIGLMVAQPDAGRWMAEQLYLARSEETAAILGRTEEIAGETEGVLSNLSFSLADARESFEDLDFRMIDLEGRADDLEGRADGIESRAGELEDFMHHVCGWASDQSLSWVGTDLYWTFSALYRPLRCPRF